MMKSTASDETAMAPLVKELHDLQVHVNPPGIKVLGECASH